MAGSTKNGGLTLTGSGQDLSEVLNGLVSSLAVQAPSGDTQAQLASQMAQLASVSQTQGDAVVENTRAVVENTVAQVSAPSGTSGGGVLGMVAKVFTSGLGVTALVKGLASLFGGGGASPTPVTLTQYVAPPAIQYEGRLSRNGSEATETSVALPALWSGQDGETPQGAPLVTVVNGQAVSERRASTQITVQVQAMDSRSFLDHRDEIARAVREAMLNSHSLNDVVNEL